MLNPSQDHTIHTQDRFVIKLITHLGIEIIYEQSFQSGLARIASFNYVCAFTNTHTFLPLKFTSTTQPIVCEIVTSAIKLCLRTK